jgi:hypothetical protein
LGADEDCDVVERPATAHPALSFLADAPGFLGAVPNPNDPDLFALSGVGPQGLTETSGIVRDQPVRRGEDVAGRTVILLQPDNLRAREVVLEAKDVGDFRPAPGVDRLVVSTASRCGGFRPCR